MNSTCIERLMFFLSNLFWLNFVKIIVIEVRVFVYFNENTDYSSWFLSLNIDVNDMHFKWESFSVYQMFWGGVKMELKRLKQTLSAIIELNF